jgi:hypothetical protein
MSRANEAAFSRPASELKEPGHWTYHTSHEGVSRLEYFAAHALIGLLSQPMVPADIAKAMEKAKVKDPMELFSRNAYDLAQEMVNEGERRYYASR